ncbi:caspase family protein [Marinicella sp. W31]|uniref:caspase family protein n=1 Tax=Marinicella sp. W31 TaxID=3023713 RepID=UPI0037572211
MADHAIVIGINDYPGISRLDGPCNDADAFLKWVEAPGPGNVDSHNIHKLLAPGLTPDDQVSSAQPFSDQISQKFNDVMNGQPTAHIGDRLYVFVAGHGMSDINSAESTALIAANARRTDITLPHVVITEFIHYFRRSYTFKEIVLIMDCCRDANVLRPLNKPGILQGQPHPKAKEVRVFQANATVWSQKSFEKEFDGITRGIFSVTLMEALEKAPTDDNKVTGKVIKNYIEQHIKTIAGDKDIEEPDISGKGHEHIVFFIRDQNQADQTATAVKISVHVENAVGDEVVELYDGTRTRLEFKTATTGSVEFQVGAGLYKVVIQNTNRSALMEVVNDHEETI